MCVCVCVCVCECVFMCVCLCVCVVVPLAALGVPLGLNMGEFPYQGYTGQALGHWGGVLGIRQVGPFPNWTHRCKLTD